MITEQHLLIGLLCYILLGVLNIMLIISNLKLVNTSFVHLDPFQRMTLVNSSFTPIIQIWWLIHHINGRKLINRMSKRNKGCLGKKIIFLLLFIPMLSFGQCPKETVGPITSFEVSINPLQETIGIIHGYNRLLLSAEIGGPSYSNNYTKLFRLGIGGKIYVNEYYDYSFNAMVVGTQVYEHSPPTMYMDATEVKPLSVELGVTKNIDKFVSSIYIDLLNQYVKITFGMRF